jgi:hypothetical protein
MMIEAPHDLAAKHAFVILGRSSREAACADPRMTKNRYGRFVPVGRGERC